MTSEPSVPVTALRRTARGRTARGGTARGRTARRRTAAALLTLAVGAEPTVLTPIGGGYEESTLAGFALASAEGASGGTVDLVVVPSAYGDSDKERKANLSLAQRRTDQVDAACDA